MRKVFYLVLVFVAFSCNLKVKNPSLTSGAELNVMDDVKYELLNQYFIDASFLEMRSYSEHKY